MHWQWGRFWMRLGIGKDISRQVEAVFNWINTVARENDRILMDYPGYRCFFYFEFPLRYGDWPRILHRLAEGETLTFVIRQPQCIPLNDPWVRIFSSSELEIFENKTRISSTPPLRWGLTDEEKKLALKIACDSLELFLSKSERLAQDYFRVLPPRFYLRTDLDVALWVNGRLRGSAVVENRNLGEGIAEAAILASRDSRFKPLSAEELLRARIEITLMHDLRIPLSIEERKKNIIYPEKGYLLRRGPSKGWYLPEVFNVRRFRSLEGFLGDLAEEKSGLSRSAAKNAEIFMFEVDDFIESSDHTAALNLYGPVVKNTLPVHDSEFLIQRLRSAADWLCRIREPDGNIPAIIDPLTGRTVKQIDWPRLAFTAWALAEFGKAVSEEKYTQAARKSFGYLKEHLISNLQFPVSNFELTLAYFGQLSLSLGKPQEVAVVANKILSRLNSLNFEPITSAQIAGFLKIALRHGIVRTESRTYLDDLLKILKENFEKNLKGRQPINLAVWAELVNTFWGVDQEFSQKVADWLKNQQFPNGAFPESTASDFVYTRGTGKIFEVLALEPEKNKETLERVLRWLFSMQYTEENTFFVPEEILPKIIGAFRHDYFNHEAWIDAAAHVLLGAVRHQT